MSKVRIKANTFGFTKFLDESAVIKTCIKSGVSTKCDAKFKIDDYLSFSFFENQIVHSRLGFDNKINAYNDNKTIFFIEKNVIDSLNIEEKYIENNNFNVQNKILNSPNTFYGLGGSENSYSTRLLNTSSIYYDRLLKENYLSTKESSYTENRDIISKDEKYDIISIKYDLGKSQNKDLYLSFSKGQTTREISFPDGESFYSFNGNTAYFYNNDFIKNGYGPHDYIGNISKNYFNNASTFINSAPVCFSSVTPYNALYVYEGSSDFENIQWGGIPIDSFGFPYSSKFDAEPRHTIPASKYITKPFVIEKVKIRFKMSNWSVSKALGDARDYFPCINFVNFFIMNQREKINKNSLVQNKTVSYKDISVDPHLDLNINLDGLHNPSDTLYTTNNKDQNSTFSEDQINNMEAGIFSDFIQSNKIPNIDDSFGSYNSNKSQQKEIITSITIANYASANGNPDNYKINVQKIRQISDLVIDKSQKPLEDASNSAECIYYDEDFEITAPVKNFYKNNFLPAFTNFNVFPKKEYSTKTNFEKRTFRSFPGENLSSNLVNQEKTDDGIMLYEKDYEEGTYILEPSDNLVLGVSLSTQFNTQEFISETDSAWAQRFGEDLVKISCDENSGIQLDLIGYYLENKNKKTIKNKEIKSYKNSKRKGYEQQENIDRTGSNLSYLEQNFYDRDFAGKVSYNVNKNKYSNNNKTQLGNFFELPTYGLIPTGQNDFVNVFKNMKYDNTLTSEYSIFEKSNGEKVKHPIKQYFNKYSFGQIVDKLNFHRHYQYEKSNYYNIYKKFLKGYYIQKVPATISAKLKFDFSKINSFKGTNYLLSEIMSSPNIKSGESYAIDLSIKDNVFQEVKLHFSDLALQGTDEHEAQFYDSENKIYTCINYDLKEKFTLTNGFYLNDINISKRKFLEKIVNGINKINSQIQVSTAGTDPKDFKIAATASIVLETLSTDYPEIKISLNNNGFLNNANISIEDINSGIIVENFAIEEGDLLNSYNTNSNSTYNNETIIFKDR